MGHPRDVAEAIRHLAGTHEQNFIVLADAEVLDYDQPSRTCTVQMIDGQKQSTLDNVRLMTEIDDGNINLPTVGSTVTILFSTFTDPVIVSYGAVDQMVLKGGNLGGLCIVPVLIQKINALENLLNDVIAKYNEHIHPVSGANTGPTTTIETETITPTEQNEIENTKITHGNL